MAEIPSLLDRAVAISSYYTYGCTGVIWILVSYLVLKKGLSRFMAYHIYQSVFISVFVFVISMAFSIFYSLTVKLPLIGKMVYFINLYLFDLPIYFSFSFIHLIMFMIFTFLSLGALFGKMSYFPFVSDIIKANIRM